MVLALAYGEKDLETNIARIKSVVKSGQALTKFKQMVEAQKGDLKYIDNPDLLPKAKYILPVYATETGYVKQIDADMVGSLAIYLGAGRMSDSSKIDNTSGIVLQKKIGSEVKVGEIVAYVHANDENKAISAVKNLSDAFKYSNKPIMTKSRVLETYGI